MRIAALLVALLACACSDPAPSPASDLAAQSSPLADATLTPDGLGALRIGMTLDEARAAFGDTLQQGEPSVDNPGCAEWSISRADAAGVSFMTIDGRVHRITVSGEASFATTEGIRLGSTAANVHAAYPNGVRENAEYFPAPAHEFYVWTDEATASGLHFEIGERETVGSMDAGHSVRHIGGCF